MPQERQRLATLVSGGGTTAAEIIKASQSGEISNLDIACVIASKAGIGALQKALDLGVDEKDIVIVNRSKFRTLDGKIDQEAFGEALIFEMKKRGVTVVTQNGWLPLTPENVIRKFEGAIFNQHPGPLPDFGGEGMYGRRVHSAVLAVRRLTGREMWTEVVAQRVHPEFDKGPVVGSRRVGILKDDTVDDLQQRVLPLEHELQIELLQHFVRGEINEAPRSTLMLPGQEYILAQAKRFAITQYPKG